MARFNLNEYETVEDRLIKFWTDHKDGRVHTEIHHWDEKFIVVKALVFTDRDDPRPVATGIAEEMRGSGHVNNTNHVENCETSAIGRALANMNYATKGKRPSREEMAKANGPEPKQAEKSPQIQAQEKWIQMGGTRDFWIVTEQKLGKKKVVEMVLASDGETAEQFMKEHGVED